LVLWRVYRAGGRHPVVWSRFRSFGPLATARFDHHPPPALEDPDLAILYAALDVTGAVAEAFQVSRTIDRSRQEPWLVGVETVRVIAALDLAGTWPTRAGASQAIATGRREIARGWSRAIHATFPEIEALLYRSSMAGGSRNVALYERAADAIPAHPIVHVPLTHPGLDVPVRRLADRLGYELL
jgi:hypothetical protein